MTRYQIISGLIAISASISLASAQQKKSSSSKEKLIANPESNTFSIIEILFRQSRNKDGAQADYAASLKRLEGMLDKFIKDYPASDKKTYALYMLYVVLKDQNNTKKAGEVLMKLASERPGAKHDNFVAFAAYEIAVNKFAALEAGAESADLYNPVITSFSIVERYSSNAELVYDAMYRRAQAFMMKGKMQTDKAEQLSSLTSASDIFASLEHDESKLPSHIKEILPYSYAQLKTTLGGDANLQSARDLYIRFLNSKKGTAKQTVQVMWSVAKISEKLGDVKQAVQYYEKVKENSDNEKYVSDANLGIITSLYHGKDYASLIKMFPLDSDYAGYLSKIKEASSRALCACAIGQAYIDQDKNYEAAEKFFALAATYNAGARQKADAAYRRIVCLNQLQRDKGADLSKPADEFLAAFATSDDPKIAERVNMVRILYADTLRESNPDKALALYLKIETDGLSGSLQIDTEFKKIWSVYKAWSKNGEHREKLSELLDAFINKRKKSVHRADVLSMKGDVLVASGLVDEALAKYDEVIANHRYQSVFPVCVQRAARVCWDRSPRDVEKVKKYYGLLLSISDNTASDDGAAKEYPHHDINEYAKAEACFRLAIIYYDAKDIETAITYYTSAAKHNPEYKKDVDHRLIYCYFIQRNENMGRALNALKDFKADHPELYAALPKNIPAWSGCAWCMNADNQVENYELAVEFLNDAIEWKNVTSADGQQKSEPTAGVSEWFYLAKACLEFAKYKSEEKFVGGLDAIDYYLAVEKDVFRKAEALKMKAMMLNGDNRPSEALEVCKTALSLGVTGPIADSLRVVAGDSFYLMKNYDEASKMYCMAAILHDGKREFYREALYKAAAALKKNGKQSESRDYEKKLKALLKELDIPEKEPLKGLPPSSCRFVSMD